MIFKEGRPPYLQTNTLVVLIFDTTYDFAFPTRNLLTTLKENMPFSLAKLLEKRQHLIAHPSDLHLDPPQSYLFVQDFLIVLCAIVYCFAYVFYMIRTKRDRFLAGPVDLMYGDQCFFSLGIPTLFAVC